MAARLALLPTRAIGLTKRAFNRAVMPGLDAALECEAEMQDIASPYRRLPRGHRRLPREARSAVHREIGAAEREAITHVGKYGATV